MYRQRIGLHYMNPKAPSSDKRLIGKLLGRDVYLDINSGRSVRPSQEDSFVAMATDTLTKALGLLDEPISPGSDTNFTPSEDGFNQMDALLAMPTSSDTNELEEILQEHGVVQKNGYPIYTLVDDIQKLIAAKGAEARIASVDEYLRQCNILRVEPTRSSLEAFQAGQIAAFKELKGDI